MQLFDPESTVADILQVLTTSNRCAFILHDKKLIGSVSQGDLLRYFVNHGFNRHTHVSQFMNLNPISTTSNDACIHRALFIKYGVSDICLVQSDNTYIRAINYCSLIETNDDRT